MLKTTVERTLVVAAALLMGAAALPAAELHPIVEVESGYFFGAISDGKWIKADETANSIKDETTYRVYGLTRHSEKPKVASRKRRELHVTKLLSFPCRQNWKRG
jgi:hypothetical protein